MTGEGARDATEQRAESREQRAESRATDLRVQVAHFDASQLTCSAGHGLNEELGSGCNTGDGVHLGGWGGWLPMRFAQSGAGAAVGNQPVNEDSVPRLDDPNGLICAAERARLPRSSHCTTGHARGQWEGLALQQTRLQLRNDSEHKPW